MIMRKCLSSDKRGAATIELALTAPILAALVIGLTDISHAYSAKVQLEQVAQRVVEKAQQNGFQPTDETTLESEANAAATASGVSSPSANVTFWLECTTGAGATSVTTWTGSCGSDTYARYMQVDLQATYTPIIVARFAGSNANGTYTVHGIAGIRVQ
jgi:Flp pilus assembly protein TadG